MKTAFFSLALSMLGLPSCVVSSNGEPANSGGTGGGGGSHPVGPVAHDASEAWPDAPASVPAISAQDIVRACAEIVGCNPPEGSGATPLDAVSLCVGQLTWSAERAIPVSNLLEWNERAEYVVSCELAHAGDCTAQTDCYSGRDPVIQCQEDGCIATSSLTVMCNGSVAHLTKTSGSSFERDCSHAYTQCDAASPTGCTDRHFSACPADANPADHCDGDVRLGCDGAGQVSYHDCARMGGSCGAISGGEGCVYQTPPDPACATRNDVAATCESGNLLACVNGQRVSVVASGVCPMP
jgi:hypothetical protein